MLYNAVEYTVQELRLYMLHCTRTTVQKRLLVLSQQPGIVPVMLQLGSYGYELFIQKCAIHLNYV